MPAIAARLVFAVGAVLLAAGCSGASGPHPEAPRPPAGMRTVSLPHYAFAVPANWPENRPWFSDTSVEFEYDGGSTSDADLFGYAEVVDGCGTRSGPKPLPRSLVSAVGILSPQVNGTEFTFVRGAAGAWRYDIFDGSGHEHTAFNVWVHGCTKQLWLMFGLGGQPDADQVRAIAATFVARD
jgi:hypothetical protein